MSVLAAEDVENLSAAGLVTPPSSSGTRQIHKRRLNRSSDEENSHLPLTPFASISSSSSSSAASINAMYATIPELLFSLATLKYLGYDDTAANRIWHRWSNWPSTPPGRFEVDPDGEILFIDVAVGYLNRFRDQNTWDENDDSWITFMNLCGINLETQTAIMNPIYKRIRVTESCYFWIKDTIKLRYRGLEAINRASRQREMEIARARSRSGPSSSGKTGAPSTAGSSGSAKVTPSEKSEQRTISGNMRMAPGISSNTAFSKTCMSAENISGSIVLYKGIDQARMHGVFDDSGAITSWYPLASLQPTDFWGRKAAFYFTVQRDIAECYACYAKHRAEVQSVVIVRIVVPNSKIEGMSTTELQRTYWPSDEWKNLVWHSRKSLILRGELQKFKQALLIIGTISKKPTEVYQRMDSYTQIDERCVLQTKAGRNAVQYVFEEDAGEDFLGELPSGSVTVHPVSAAEFAVWEREHDFDD